MAISGIGSGPGLLGDLAVTMFRIALSAGFILLLVERKGDRLGIRFLDRLEQFELDKKYENIAAGILTVFLFSFSVDIATAILDTAIGINTWYLAFSWASTFGLTFLVVSSAATAAAIYYYAHDNQKLRESIDTIRQYLEDYM
jgi:hypothetical protein